MPRRLTLLFLLACVVAARAQAWTPPLGIPTPPFGIQEQAPARPNPWSGPVAGYYYVDEAASGATDSSNPYGFPGKPRVSIPLLLPAGAVVEVHGTYSRNHSSPAIIVCQGTASAPVFIRGVSQAEAPTFSQRWHFQGSFYIIENVRSRGSNGVKLVSPTDHAALRFSDLGGSLTGGGVAIASNTTFGGTVSYVVVVGNEIHDNGDVASTIDQDAHAITINGAVSYVWIVDNRLHDSSGDGLQVNAGSLEAQAGLHHIFVGRNEAYRTRQAGLFTKQAVDVVFSQNNVHDIINTSWSPSKCLGYQYAPERVWFLYNTCSGATFGIYSGSDSGMGSGKDVYIVGNTIYNIHHIDAYTPGTAWSNAGIMLAGGTNRYIVNNTIYDVDGGINVPADRGQLHIANNIIANVTEPQGHHLFVEVGTLASVTDVRNSFFDTSARIRFGSTEYQGIRTFQASGIGRGAGCLEGDPGLVDPAGGNFRPRRGSAAIDAGLVDGVYELYWTTYGVRIAADPSGAPRPVGSGFDIGAWEYNGAPPGSPGAVTIR